MSVGIDIGSKTIKIVELAKENNLWKLKGSGIVGYTGLTPDKLKDEKEMASMAAIIRRLHKEARISSTDISVALPESLVFTRIIKLPLLTEEEIASAIKWEAEQYIPIPINEAVVQHQVLERMESSSPPQVSVLLVAAPKNMVEKYVKVLNMAGLNASTVETELISLTRALGPRDKTVMLIDFGAKSTDIAISKNGMLSFSRSIPTAGDAFTRAVSQSLGIEYQQAEEYKRTYGLSGSQLEGKIRQALDPIIRIVSDEIRKAIQYYQTEEKGQPPTSIVLSGGTAGLPEAISFLTKLLGVEIVLGNPFAGISLDPQAAKSLAAYAPLYSIAVGLALGGE